MDIRIARKIRQIANASRANVPITQAADPLAAPVETGESYYFTNKSGHRIRYPNAYRRAYGKPIYHSSTISVEVGRLYVQYAAVCRLLGFLDSTPPEVIADAVESHVIPYAR